MKKCLLTVLAACTMAAASADTITYDQLEQAGDSVFERERHVEGDWVTGGIFLFSAQQQNESYAGSASMFNIYGGPVNLSRLDGRAFTLAAIDVAALYRGGTGGGPVQFTGMRRNGETVTHTIDVGSDFAFSTYHFSGFTGLVSLQWIDVSNFLTQFDNIVVEQAVDVPAPGTLALLALGLAGFAAGRRRSAHC